MDLSAKKQTPLDADRNYARLAWWVISGAFILFCLLLAGSCYAGLRFKDLAEGQPEQPATLNIYARGVEVRRAGLVQFENPAPNTILHEGDTIQVAAANVAPGIAATVTLFDGSAIDLWPGSRLTFEQIQTTRYSARNQRVALLLEAGLVRLRLVPRADQQYVDVRYTLAVQPAGRPLEQAALDLGGSYRIRILDRSSPTVSASERTTLGAVLPTEYVVERGHMLLDNGLQQTDLRSGQKMTVNRGEWAAPLPAEWQMIRDSHFTIYSQAEYNNTTAPVSITDVLRSDTWFVFGDPAPEATVDGYFYIVSGCLRRNVLDASCEEPLNNVAQFRRDKPPGHEKGFRTAITQTLALDTTPYQEVRLRFQGRIELQSLNKAGFLGTECALGVEIRYTNDENNPDTHTFCFYARDDGSQLGVVSAKPYITSQRLPFGLWQAIDLDLSAALPRLRRLDKIEIHGNGHDYISEVAEVELVLR